MGQILYSQKYRNSLYPRISWSQIQHSNPLSHPSQNLPSIPSFVPALHTPELIKTLPEKLEHYSSCSAWIHHCNSSLSEDPRWRDEALYITSNRAKLPCIVTTPSLSIQSTWRVVVTAGNPPVKHLHFAMRKTVVHQTKPRLVSKAVKYPSTLKRPARCKCRKTLVSQSQWRSSPQILGPANSQSALFHMIDNLPKQDTHKHYLVLPSIQS